MHHCIRCFRKFSGIGLDIGLEDLGLVKITGCLIKALLPKFFILIVSGIELIIRLLGNSIA